MKRTMGKAISALVYALVWSPLFVAAGIVFFPAVRMLWIALLPFAAALIAAVAGSFPGKARVAGGIAGALVCIGAFVLFFWPAPPYAMLVPILVLYWMVLRRALAVPFEEWPVTLLFLGLGIHFVVMIFLVVIIEQAVVAPLLQVLFLLYLPAFFLYVNHATTLEGTSARDGRRPPRRIRAGNAKLAAVLSAIVLVAVNFAAIRDAFRAVLGWLGEITGAIARWLAALFASEPVEEMMAPQEGAMEMLPAAAEQEPSQLYLLLEKILGTLVDILLIAAAVFALFQLGKWLVKIVRKIRANILAATQSLSGEVEDKTESILDWEELRQAARARLTGLRRRRVAPVQWAALDSRGRIRYLYRQWLAGRGTPKPSATARELLGADYQEEAASLYERARYSSLSIEETDVAAMQAAMQEKE